MARIWKEPYTVDKALDVGIHDFEGAPVLGPPNARWVYYVKVCGFTFAFFSLSRNGPAKQVRVGAVASRFTVTDCVVVPPALVALQVSVVPAVSVEIVVGPQPVETRIADWASVLVQETFTLPRYQPLRPWLPVTVDLTTGGVVSVRRRASHFEAWVVRTVTRTSVPAPPTNQDWVRLIKEKVHTLATKFLDPDIFGGGEYALLALLLAIASMITWRRPLARAIRPHLN